MPRRSKASKLRSERAKRAWITRRANERKRSKTARRKSAAPKRKAVRKQARKQKPKQKPRREVAEPYMVEQEYEFEIAFKY